MDSRLIYAINKALIYKIVWEKATIDTEWIFIGDTDKVNTNIIEELLNNYFEGKNLFISFTRTKSFETEIENAIKAISTFLGFENFFMWDSNFKKVIEISKIGVMRKGKIIN